MQAEWWEKFFKSELWIDLQRTLWSEEATLAAADGILNLLQLAPQAKILDVPCGEGRLSIALASRGYRLTGVDITKPFLDDARAKAKEQKLDVALEQRDMRDLPWEKEFDAAICFWGSFGYFEDEGNIEFLRAVAHALKPGGKLLIDIHVQESLLPRFQRRWWMRVEDILVLEDRSFNVATSRVNVEWTLTRGDKEDKLTSSIRVYSYRELCTLLQGTGFTDCTGYATLQGEPFQLGSPRLLMVAERQG